MQPNGTNSFAEKFFTPARFGGLLALLVFASFPQVVLGLETFVARDFGLFAYPLADFQQTCLWNGIIPLWNPYNNCGVPFLAQWNTMPLYPPALFYLLLPLKWSLGMFSLLHLWWAGLGMYFLARRWSGNNFAAAFAGTAFAFNGFTLNLIMWPSHIATFSWMPWVILAVERAWREGWQKIIIAAFVGAMQMLGGGPETILLTWLIASALWLQQISAGEIPRGAMLWRFPLVVALVISLTLPQLLPFLDLVAHAQRESGFADLRWSMPGFGLANFLVPTAFGSRLNAGIFFQHGQSWTSSYYLGMATLWLAMAAILFLRGRKIWLLAGLALTGLLLALGENAPLLPLLRKFLPQLSFITYPVKYLMITIFAAPLLAALALAEWSKTGRKIPSLGAALLLALLAALAWTQAAPLAGDDMRLAWWSGISRAGFLLLTALVLLAWVRGWPAKLFRFVPVLLLLVLWADVLTHQPSQNPTVPPWVYQLRLMRERLALEPSPELGGPRVMVSPMAAREFIGFASSDPQVNFLAKRAGLAADVNLLDGVPKVDGFISLAPRESDAVLSLFYAGTNASYPRLENFLGVAQRTRPGTASEWLAQTNFLPLVTAGQSPVFLADAAVLTALTQSGFDGGKVVYLPPEERGYVSVTNVGGAKILESKFGVNSVDIVAEAANAALVVVAQTWYHHWRATVDGRPARLLRANMAFQAVEIPAGRHKIELIYRDKAFEIGGIVSAFMWFNCLVAYICIKRRLLPPTEPDPDEDENYL